MNAVFFVLLDQRPQHAQKTRKFMFFIAANFIDQFVDKRRHFPILALSLDDSNLRLAIERNPCLCHLAEGQIRMLGLSLRKIHVFFHLPRSYSATGGRSQFLFHGSSLLTSLGTSQHNPTRTLVCTGKERTPISARVSEQKVLKQLAEWGVCQISDSTSSA